MNSMVITAHHRARGHLRRQEFLSYARLVKPEKESAGTVHGHSGKKIGNAHLKSLGKASPLCA
jgi:hypothetical protein